MRKAERRAGFTLVEILVVLAIVGILSAIFGMGLIQNIRRAQLGEAAATVHAELSRARSTAQRRSTDQPVTWTADSLSAGASSVSIPNGARIVTAPAVGYVYTAPYGEFDTPSDEPDGLRLELVDASGRWHTAVDAVGVTGKVMRRRVVALGDSI